MTKHKFETVMARY